MGRAETLAHWANTHRWQRGVELGVYRGQTFFHLLDNCPRLYLIGVDTWKAYEGKSGNDKTTGWTSYGAQAPMDRYFREVSHRAREYGIHAAILRMDTTQAAQLVEGDLDFVFVDADHTTEAVARDITMWLPKVRAGGCLCGHDANWPAIQTALANCGIEHSTHPGNVWAHWKE